MPDTWFSEPNSRGAAPARPLRGQFLLVAAAASLVIGGLAFWRMGMPPRPPAPRSATTAVTAPAKNPVLDELVRTTRALNDSQQQAIDQLQVLQDTVASQAAALKVSSDQVTELNNKLEALRQSFAITQPAADPEAKSAERATKRSPPRPRHKTRRVSKRHGSRAHR